MARLFNDAVSEYLEVASGVCTDVPLTLAAWFYSDDYGAFHTTLSIADNAESDHYCALQIIQSVYAIHRQGPVTSAVTAIAHTANTWHHACGVFAAQNSRAVYLDGGSKGTNADAVDGAMVANTTAIGRTCDSSPGRYMSGRIAEAAAWNVALTDAEVAILAACYSPLFVRPQNLVAYYPLIRDEDQDRVGGYDLTAFNTPSIAVHPPIIYPAPPHVLHISAAAPPVAIPRHPAVIFQRPALV